jgi:selenocysteine lyase/cysteine desulfurase
MSFNPLTRRGFLASAGAAWSVQYTAAERSPGNSVSLPELPGTEDPDWQVVREAFSLPEDLIYMNNGSLGPCPGFVKWRALGAWDRLERDPVREGFGPMLEAAEEVRSKAASFLGCSVEEIAITRNTTEGMNMIAQGARLQPGDRVLTTNHEHAGGMRGWEYLASHHGVVIDQVELPVPPDSPEQVVRRFEKKMDERTRVISISHVTSITGLRMPVEALSDLARANNALLVVDGAQAPGGMDVDLRRLRCDAYATSTHKWMLAPKGTGLLYVRKETQNAIQPMALQDGFEVYTGAVGTRDLPSIAGLGAAIDFLNYFGFDNLTKRNMRLRAFLYKSLDSVPEIRVASPADGVMSAPMVAFELEGERSASDVAGKLREDFGVEVKVLPVDVFNGIRVSTHVYNSEKDIEVLANGLKKILK